jgi:hypothetical protein
MGKHYIFRFGNLYFGELAKFEFVLFFYLCCDGPMKLVIPKEEKGIQEMSHLINKKI